MAKGNCNSFNKGRLTEKVEQHENRLNKIDIILDKVRNRLPVWATLLIAVLLGTLGWFAKAVLTQ